MFIDFRLKSRKVIIKFKNINNEIITSIAFKDRIGISRDISDVSCFKTYDNITQVIMIANVKKILFIFSYFISICSYTRKFHSFY